MLLCRLGRQFYLNSHHLRPLSRAIRPSPRAPGGIRTFSESRQALVDADAKVPTDATATSIRDLISPQVPADSTKEPLPPSYRQYRHPDFMRDVWGGWHQTTVPLPKYWSSEWGLWDHTETLFGSTGDKRLELMVAEYFEIPVDSIEPLVYCDASAPVAFFAFFAEGRYYYYDEEWQTLWAYEGTFTDHDDFLARHVNEPNWPICGKGTRLGWFPEDYDMEIEECDKETEEESVREVASVREHS
ncbi:hypothetical protein C8R46DRAFT_1114451 [Mycena filopes]|nr:hypothetical protein C8R46DRAFT_1114451 [Mycena filopes]